MRLALVAVYAILWLGGAGAHLLLGRAPAGSWWAAPLFLASAAAIALAEAGGERRWLLAAGAGGFAFELLGVHTGFPFGRYCYSGVLQPQLFGVPLVLGCAWLVLLAYVRGLPWWAGALWMAALDLLIDPLAAGVLDYWRWPGGGPWFGVPLTNFAGWLLASAVLLAPAPRSQAVRPGHSRLGLSMVAFFGLVALAHKLWIPAGVAAALGAADWLRFRPYPAPKPGPPAIPAAEPPATG